MYNFSAGSIYTDLPEGWNSINRTDFPICAATDRVFTSSARNPLHAAGLIATIDVKTTAYRTALTGGASYFDALVLTPGIHTQQDAAELNNGEYPIASAMAPGEPRIFRIENQATVAFLQRISETGHLTRVRVSPLSSATPSAPIDLQASRYSASLTIAAVALSAGMEDWWALSAIGALILARLLNIFVLKRRVLWDQKDTKDAKDVGGDDIIVLLSQDRWVRMQGAVRDLTAVTAGPWLRDMNAAECCAVNFATVLTHVSVVLAFNGSPTGSMLLAGMLVLSLGLVGRANATARHLRMFSCVLGQEGPAKGYVRRKDMAEELIAEHGNEEGWAVRLGLVLGKRKGSTADQTFQSSLAPAYVEL